MAGANPPRAAHITTAARKKTPIGKWRVAEARFVASQAANGRIKASAHRTIRRRTEGEEFICVSCSYTFKNHGDKAAFQNSMPCSKCPSSEVLVLIHTHADNWPKSTAANREADFLK